jgi:hypothetical protein
VPWVFWGLREQLETRIEVIYGLSIRTAAEGVCSRHLPIADRALVVTSLCEMQREKAGEGVKLFAMRLLLVQPDPLV